MGDDWGDVDLEAYLARVGQEKRAPSAGALRDLTQAHVEAFPFENVDVVLQQHKGISPDVVAEKFFGRQRGGYCYEHCGLFALVAGKLGYPVRRVAARVQPRRPGPMTHMALVIEADGISYLVDIGFGAGILVPMPLVDGEVVDQAGWPHRLKRRDAWWILQKQQENGWEDLHEFTLNQMYRTDYEVYHHYASTHPHSPFTGQLVLMRVEPGRLRRFRGHALTVEKPDGTSETTKIEPEQLDATLRELDIVLTQQELERLLAVY
jgi:N-hydroxyarylamine O-acetyltransferase